MLMRPFHAILLLFVLLPAVVAVWWLVGWCWPLPEDAVAQYVGRDQCARCHLQQIKLWTGSDHDLAMDRATPKTVLGNFDNQEFTHFGVTSKLFRRGDDYCVTTDGPDGRMQTFTVKYTFGVRPLQQYLVEFSDGRVQCLPMAWDTQGKRWFHLYPHEAIPSTDSLHWTRPLQNWNYMCADCHTTNLQKNFDVARNTYHTTFSEINVSCETCHGPGSLHVQLADSWRIGWDRRRGYALPRLKSENSRVEIETCAPCHARRRVVYPGFRPGEKFLDYYMPELLDTELYYADGQIRDEDYEYGSFIQSKMYQNKVRCSNCHDPHSMRVKFKEGDTITDNRLCGQCHLPSKYDGPAHHHHPVPKGAARGSGTLCIDCHMPTTPYMVVDPRLDHSIRIPRPDLTVSLGIPNACTGCHHDPAKEQTPAWAESQVRGWYGERKGPPHFAHAIAAGRQGKPEGQSMLDAVCRRKDVSAMVRASALVLLSHYGSQGVEAAVSEAITDPDELVRAAAARCLQELRPDSERIRRLRPLLRDPVRAVRTEAARVLSAVPRDEIPEKDLAAFDAAMEEYLVGQRAVDDQPAAHLCMGVIHANQGARAKAESDYRTALRLDPAFIPARVNLAMLYNEQNKKVEAEREYRLIVEREPKMAEAFYALGLLVAEDGKRLAEATDLLTKATQLAPQNSRMHYNRGLALQNLGRVDEAEQALLLARKLAPQATDYVYALAIFNVQQKRWDRASQFAEELCRLAPGNPQWRELSEHIRKQGAKDSPKR